MCIEYDNLRALVTSIPAHVGPVRSEKDYHLVTMVPHDLSQPQAEAVVIVTQSYVACKFLAISEDANAAFCWQLSAVDPYPTSDGVVQPGKAVGKLGPIADATDFKRGACLIVLHISKGSAPLDSNYITYQYKVRWCTRTGTRYTDYTDYCALKSNE